MSLRGRNMFNSASKVKSLILASLVNGGDGGTVYSGAAPTTGYIVGGVVPSLVTPDSASYDTMEELLRNWVGEHIEKIFLAPAVGWWLEDENIHIDVNTHTNNLSAALKLGKAWNQLAIWDIENNCEIRV